MKKSLMQNKKNSRICFITFYFGRLPDYFVLWLNCVRYNYKYDFILYIDDRTKYNFPDNVTVKYVTFKSIVARVQKKFDFKICLSKPYKLCDYRPAFGDIFYDDIKEYDFWGTMDLDIVLGDIYTFITDDILQSYDKILVRDHFCLYRNTDDVRKHYKGKQSIGESVYRKVFTEKKIFSFGEASTYGVYNIWKYNNWRMFDKDIIADIDVWNYDFIVIGDAKVKSNVFLYKDGKLYRKYYIDNKIITKQYLYMHLQKRKMIIANEVQSDNYLIVPNKFIFLNNNKELTNRMINLYIRKKYFFYNLCWKCNKIVKKILKEFNEFLYEMFNKYKV